MDFKDMQFMGSTRVIVSVYPEPLEQLLEFGPTMAGGRTVYRIEGAPKGEYRTLPVTDGFQAIIDIANVQHVGHTPMTAAPESAEKIARELVRGWTTGAGSGNGMQPGVMVLGAGKHEPTKADIDHITAIQRQCFEMLVHKGDEYFASHKFANINEKHRIAAAWLGIDPKEHKWMLDLGTGMDRDITTRDCPHCYSRVDVRATWCKECKQPIDKPVDVPLKPKAAAPPVEKVFTTKAVHAIPVAPPLQSPSAGA